MKLIQILALAGALAVAAAAQSGTNSQSGTASGQTGNADSQKKKTASATKPSAAKSTQNNASANQGSAVKLTEVKSGNQAATTGKSSGPANSTSKNTAAAGTASKTGNQTPAGANKSAAGKGPSTNAGTTPKTPVMVKPVQPPATTAKASSTANDKSKAANDKNKKKAAASVTASKQTKVKVVPQKTASAAQNKALFQQMKTNAAGRRDPFVSVIRSASLAPAGPNCTVGKRCLYIPELVLKGIAKDTDGQMLAVVVSNTQRAYFLRENDQVFNGSVQKITGDSVVFREFATDRLGRETAHEVVKRIPKT